MSELETEPAPATHEPSAQLIEACARASHEVNRAYCTCLGELQVVWDLAPDWQKNSARSGVRAVLMGEAKGPADQHALWLELKRAEGWTYGAEKDFDKKTHPCMLEYAELPLAQRAKDFLFRATVQEVARILGY